MRLLQVNSVCGSGSTGRIAEGIHRLATARGDDSRIAFGRGTSPDGVDSIRIGSSVSVGVHAALSRVTDRQGFYSSRATSRLLSEIDAFRPDIVHLHNIHGYYLNIAMLFPHLAEIQVPVVWTLHDCWPLTGHCAHFDFIGCDRWKTGCYACPQKLNYPQSLLMDRSKANWAAKRRLFAMPRSIVLVTPSDWMSALVADSHLRHRRSSVIRNGVDTSVFRPTPGDFRVRHGLQGSRMILGVAARWGQRKGLDDFITLAGLLQDPANGLQEYSIALVGLSAAQRRKMPGNVVVIDSTADARELAQIYTAADVLFNPTREDNYPTINLEALSCGTPVVTYNTGGSPESVQHGVDGYVLSRATPEEFAAFLLRGGLSDLRADCRDDLSEGSTLASYLELYDELLAQRIE